MNLISVTRLRIRKWRYLPPFFYFTVLSMRQARRAEGNLHTSIQRQSGLIFWTITVWRDENSMKAFRHAGAHKRAMPKLRDWCDEATYVHWPQETADPPDLPTSYDHLVRDGIVSHVIHPSSDHATRAFSRPGQ